jgi:hypothetical protein
MSLARTETSIRQRSLISVAVLPLTKLLFAAENSNTYWQRSSTLSEYIARGRRKEDRTTVEDTEG